MTNSLYRLLISITALASVSLGGCGRNCFAAGTQIDTPEGPVAIEDLEVGDSVWSFDHASGERRGANVLNTFRHSWATVREMKLDDGRSLRVTEEHPIYSTELGRYVEASEFSVSTRRRERRRSDSRSLGPPRGGVTVYNIEVSGSHNYFAEGAVVHNKSHQSLTPPLMFPHGTPRRRHFRDSPGDTPRTPQRLPTQLGRARVGFGDGSAPPRSARYSKAHHLAIPPRAVRQRYFTVTNTSQAPSFH